MTYTVEASNPWTGGAGPSRLVITVHRGSFRQVRDYLSPAMIDFTQIEAANAKAAKQAAADWIAAQRQHFNEKRRG